MMIGCKNGCLCEDISKEYCCIECSNSNTCKEVCMFLLNKDVNKEKVLELCKYSFEVSS